MPQPASFQALLRHRRTLLLQGPMGPFFAKLAAHLRGHGQHVFKVNFNAGDELFYRGRDAVAFDADAAGWTTWLRRFVIEHGVTAIVLFGQSRPVHQPVADIARALGVELFVFEEGYDRPNHVTLEIGGVNAQSPLPRERGGYDAIPADVLPHTRRPVPAGQTFWRTAVCAVAYALAMWLLCWRYPRAVHHRPLHPLVEGAKWLHGGWRKLRNLHPDRAVLQELVAPGRSGRWFLVPLQVHNDSQILRHSLYANIEAVIDEVLASFAAHADPDDWLVLKHHPMDRAYRNFASHINARAQQFGIAERVRYVHDVHLPTLLKHTRGMVTVNSTTGLQALHHRKPVVTLGECVYAVQGLVHAGPLDKFWRQPGEVDMQLFYRFRHHLIEQTQLNGSFYADVPAFATSALQPAPPASAPSQEPAPLSASPAPTCALVGAPAKPARHACLEPVAMASTVHPAVSVPGRRSTGRRRPAAGRGALQRQPSARQPSTTGRTPQTEAAR